MLYCLYYKKECLWPEYFSNIMSKHDVIQFFMFHSVIALTFAEFFCKISFLD